MRVGDARAGHHAHQVRLLRDPRRGRAPVTGREGARRAAPVRSASCAARFRAATRAEAGGYVATVARGSRRRAAEQHNAARRPSSLAVAAPAGSDPFLRPRLHGARASGGVGGSGVLRSDCESCRCGRRRVTGRWRRRRSTIRRVATTERSWAVAGRDPRGLHARVVCLDGRSAPARRAGSIQRMAPSRRASILERAAVGRRLFGAACSALRRSECALLRSSQR